MLILGRSSVSAVTVVTQVITGAGVMTDQCTINYAGQLAETITITSSHRDIIKYLQQETPGLDAGNKYSGAMTTGSMDRRNH